MGNIQVTTQVQAIYPDGYQDSFVIKNNGPYLIYVGQNTAIDNTDIPVPPSGTLAWDAQRPLYVVADSKAGAKSTSISLVRNSESPVFGNDFDSVLWSKTFGGTVSAMDNWVDCSAFNSVTLSIYNPANTINGIPIGTNYYDVMIQWFDAQGNFLSQEYAQPPWVCLNADGGNSLVATNYFPQPANNSLFNVKARFRVKGAFMYATIANRGGAGQTTWAITATTRNLKPRMSFTIPEGLPYIGAGLTGFTQYVGSDSFTIQNGSSGYNFNDVTLPPIGRHWRIAMRNGAAITAAGTLNIRSTYDATYPTDTFAIAAVGAGIIQSFDTYIPIYEPIRVSIPNPPQSAGPVNLVDLKMTFTCLDYDT